jgi:IS30 family transposase
VGTLVVSNTCIPNPVEGFSTSARYWAIPFSSSVLGSASISFSHPYSAWERSANENMNGLVRQYIPKNRNLATVTHQEMDVIMHKLNHRPRICLDFRSPFEVFFEQSSVALKT